jgi:hypothetical protein
MREAVSISKTSVSIYRRHGATILMTGMFILTAPAEHNVVLGYSHNDINYRIRDRIFLISCEKLSALKN